MRILVNHYGMLFTMLKDEEYENVQVVAEEYITHTTPTTITVKAEPNILYDILCTLSKDFDIDIL